MTFKDFVNVDENITSTECFKNEEYNNAKIFSLSHFMLIS